MRKQPKYTHFKVVCISLYNDDLQMLDAAVETLKAQHMSGPDRVSRSALIRYAVSKLDLNAIDTKDIR